MHSVLKALIPSKVRAFPPLRRLYSFVSQLRLPVFLLEGKERSSGETLTTLFLGDEGGVRYLSHVIYGEEVVKKNLGKIFLWRIKSRLNLGLPKADLIFIKLNRDSFFSRFLSQQKFIIIPEWVLFLFDLSKPLHEVWKLSRKQSLRRNVEKLKRNNFSYEMTRYPAKLDYFYHRMYLPYSTKRYGELSFLIGFREMERIFKKGQLLLVKKGDDYVSGSIIKMEGDTVFFPYVGVTEGKIEHLKAGALNALYYFTILWAKEQGYKWLDFGYCRPFMKDGVFIYKKHWGMETSIRRRFGGIIGLKICNFHRGALSFLKNNPFIFLDQGKLKGMNLIDEDHPLTHEEVQSHFTTHSIPGLDCLVILSTQGFTQQSKEFGGFCPPQRFVTVNTPPRIIRRISTICSRWDK